MDRNFLIQLTNNLYRLTFLFPKKEPLRYKIRELADDILAKCLTLGVKQNPKKCNEERARYIEEVGGKLEVLDGFFEVAKNQNWVSPSEILNLQQEYSKLKEDLKKLFGTRTQQRDIKVKFQQVPIQQVPIEIGSPQREESPTFINQRQQKILEILKEKGKVQVWEIKKIFSEVTKRTLRRDFEKLLKQGKIERIGERNNTFYQIKMG